LNSGEVNVGVGGTNAWTFVGVDAGLGIVRLNGGVFSAGILGIPRWYGAPSAGGIVHVDGGEIHVTGLILGSGGADGKVDITKGTLRVAGDARTTVSSYISSGHITAYGSNNPGAFSIVYDGLDTVVTAANPKLATNPTPVDGAEHVSPSAVLSWEAPVATDDVTYNLYIGTDGNTFTLQSEGQPTLGFDPNLDFMTKYYWRVDVNDPNGGNPVVYPGIVWTFTTGGQAYDPHPGYKQAVVSNNILTQKTVNSVTLSWQGGAAADSHEVYLGTSFDAVSEADRFDITGIYKGVQGVEDTNYGPAPVKPDSIYYWRIDEVNESRDPARLKGDIWQFSVPSYFYSGEDFESYTKTSYLKEIWKDGTQPGNNTGSLIALETDDSRPVVYEGHNSVRLEYDNSGPVGSEYLSEIRGKCIVRDWTKYDVKAMLLHFYGQPGNDAERFYVALEDADGNVHVANYVDSKSVTESAWHAWNIALQDFNDGGVDLTDVNTIYIGFGDRDNPVTGGSGTVYIDAIRLHQRRCVPDHSAVVDFNRDCTVNIDDLAMFAGEWLDIAMASEMPPDGCRVYLLAGQSNMVGVGLSAQLPADLQLPQADVEIYASGQLDPCNSDHWLDLQPGLGFNEYCFGPEITFGRRMADAHPSDVILIKYAVGGTNLWHDWRAPDAAEPNGGPQYAAFMSTVADAFATLGLSCSPYVAGMIWMQGESDSSDLDAALAYEQNLTDFIESIRSDLGLPDIPFVIGQISNQYGYAYGLIVQAAQQTVSQTLHNTALVVTDDLTLNADRIHYDAAGQIALGYRFAEDLISKGDINGDLKTDFEDFACFGAKWLETTLWP
jgi:hypothetical protein